MKKPIKTLLINSALLFFGINALSACGTMVVKETRDVHNHITSQEVSFPFGNYPNQGTPAIRGKAAPAQQATLAKDPNRIVDGSYEAVVIAGTSSTAPTTILIEDHSAQPIMPKGVVSYFKDAQQATLEGTAWFDTEDGKEIKRDIVMNLSRNNDRGEWEFTDVSALRPGTRIEDPGVRKTLQRQFDKETGTFFHLIQGGKKTELERLMTVATKALELQGDFQPIKTGMGTLVQTKKGVFKGVVTNPNSATALEIHRSNRGDRITATTSFRGMKHIPEDFSITLDLIAKDNLSKLPTLDALVNEQLSGKSEANEYLAGLPLAEARAIYKYAIMATLADLQAATSPNSPPQHKTGFPQYNGSPITKPYFEFDPKYPFAVSDGNGKIKTMEIKDVPSSEVIKYYIAELDNQFKKLGVAKNTVPKDTEDRANAGSNETVISPENVAKIKKVYVEPAPLGTENIMMESVPSRDPNKKSSQFPRKTL